MKNFINIFLFTAMIFVISGYAFAQDKSASAAQPGGGKKAVIFKIPEGTLPAEMIKPHKGLLMLDAKGPAGLFIAYTPDEQKSADYVLVLREMLSKFFDTDKNITFQWKEATLPVSEKIPDETGQLLTATGKEIEVQIIAYTRTISEGQDVVYGYFAMKDLKKPSNSAKLADDKGNGIKLLDNFRKKLTVSK